MGERVAMSKLTLIPSVNKKVTNGGKLNQNSLFYKITEENPPISLP